MNDKAHPNKNNEWETLKIFTKGEPTIGKLAVRLLMREQKSNQWRGGHGPAREQYKLQVGVMLKDHNSTLPIFVLGFRPEFKTQNGKVALVSRASEIADLCKEAEEYAHMTAQYNEDQRMDERIESEKAQSDRGKPITRRTGKTQRKRDKHRQHANSPG